MEHHYAHERFMALALNEARIALEEGNVPIGAVVVLGDEVVASARNLIETAEDDTLHAEAAAIRRIPQVLWRNRRRCTVYTTMEPCAMCLGTIIYSSVDRIVWGASDPLCATHATIECTPYYRKKRLVLLGGVLERECQELLNEYVRRSPKRPYLHKPLR